MEESVLALVASFTCAHTILCALQCKLLTKCLGLAEVLFNKVAVALVQLVACENDDVVAEGLPY